MAVKVQFQIGHTSKLRSKKTVEGFTHDWELYVKGVQQADISAFVEKIIFNLHESFQKPKRVCNKPPYVIQESGYAGFIVFIDIYFRNRDEPKKVQFNYDLDLQQTGPPQHRHDVKTFIFDNPSEEYRQKLLKGGGVPVSGVMAGTQPIINTNIATMQGATVLNHSPADGHKALLNEVKKHKPRLDDARSNSFANLFGPPITKTSAVVATAATTKHSPDNKTSIATVHASHPPSSATSLPGVKEKSSKDKDKSSEKSKERSEKREKHHKQSLTSPHKEGRSESKKSDGNKHEKRDKTDEKSKKDKNRDKDKERDRDKSTGASVNNSSSGSKKPSPKPAREHSPHKSVAAGIAPINPAISNSNSLPRPSSSNSGKLEDTKTSSKSSKDSSGEIKAKESKQKDSSSSSGKKSKKEKKDKDKEREKEKRHEEKEKLKLAESQQRPSAKEDASKMNNNNMNTHTNNVNSLDNKNSKPTPNTPLNANVPNDVIKKPEKLPKQDLFKTVSDKSGVSNTPVAPAAPLVNSSTHSSNEKKSSSNSSLNSNSNTTEKDKRSHKHKKKEKNKDKDKDKDRERDKERDKDKDKEKDKDKDKDKDKEKEKEAVKKDKEAKEKHTDEKIAETFSSHPLNTNAGRVLPTPTVNTTEQQSNSLNKSAPNITATNNATAPYTAATAIHSTSSSVTSSKSSKNKDKKSKDKSSTKEEKLKHKVNDVDTSESKAKQAKLSSSTSMHNSSSSSSLSTSSSTSSVSTSITNATKIPPNPTQPAAVPQRANNTAEKILDLSDPDSLPSAPAEQIAPLPSNNPTSTKPSQQPSPIITHSESSNSSFPDLQLPKQQPTSKPAQSRERAKSFTAPAAVPPVPLISPACKEPSKATKSAVKEKSLGKPAKEEEKEKKKRRNSQAVNTFIEPPIKQLKAKEQPKSVREKSKSPLLRNAGSRASISAEASNTFLQPSASPSSTAAAAPLPPPSSAPAASHSPALSAAEAVGNATSATANAATCNSNSASSSSTANSTGMAAPNQLPLDYLSELQELHHKIMTLQDNEDLQHVVELIAATGCYEITTKTFDFDLCKLDRGTVQRLQEFFATSVS